ncbi:MAG: Mth938-like domain-containing protein [Pseudomonadota bacterium]
MKLHLAPSGGQNLFTGYGPGYVSVNGARQEKNIIVTAERIMDWNIAGFEALNARDFELLLGLQPEIAILGTGDTLRFPVPMLSRPLVTAGVGFEVMDTKAACRTYNILMAEGRKVAAAILIV